MKNDGFYKNLGKNIKKRREELRLTQEQLAEKSNKSLNFIGKIEVAFCRPSLNSLIDLAQVLDTTVSNLTQDCESE